MKIVWEKVNYSLDTSRGRWINDDIGEDFNNSEEHDIDDLMGQDLLPIGRVVSTPMGIFEVDDAFNPLHHFNFWIANTDFDLTQEFLDKLDIVPGVEGIKIMSRYRFVMAIGTLFDATKVRLLIELTVGTLSLSQTVLDKKKELEDSGKQWTMFIYPNLNSFISVLEDDPERDSKIKKINELNDNGSGLLLSSNQ
jgi:hypothetical protein